MRTSSTFLQMEKCNPTSSFPNPSNQRHSQNPTITNYTITNLRNIPSVYSSTPTSAAHVEMLSKQSQSPQTTHTHTHARAHRSLRISLGPPTLSKQAACPLLGATLPSRHHVFEREASHMIPPMALVPERSVRLRGWGRGKSTNAAMCGLPWL